MLYQISDGTVSAGGRLVLDHVDFEVKGKEKIALVGRNGAGKTTLLRVIAGEIPLDRDDKRCGRIVQDRKLTIGMLRQNPDLDGNRTVEELLLAECPVKDRFSRERYSYEMEYDRIFTGFGFRKEEKKRKFSSFSGGEQTKICLIRLLLLKPDILLLDEPTNHLDIHTVEWLEDYLKTYEKAVVMVSHDRFFLDRTAEIVYALQEGKLKRYWGNYTEYRKQRIKELETGKKAYERQKQELERLEELVVRFKNKPRKAAFARSRKKMMERMELIEKPLADDVHTFAAPIEPLVLGSKWVLEAEQLKIGYDKVLLELSLRVRRGQKIAILGDNGAGKSAFLETAGGLGPPPGGRLSLGNQTVMGYFDQHSAEIQSEQTVLEHFCRQFPALTQKEARSALAGFLFGGKKASVKVSSLSGGEKSRLLLAELLLSRPNLLLLDEPTNHMDIQARETLESAFQAYQGTLLFVSHDRYFIDQVAESVLIFEGQSVMYYPFGYSHYLERMKADQGESPAARIRAEEQALLAGIRAVPKAERHRLREQSTREAYEDWQLRLASEELESASLAVEKLWAIYQRENEERQEAEWHRWAEAQMGESPPICEEEKEMEDELCSAWEAWTRACLNWYDTWEETEQAAGEQEQERDRDSVR